jgi:hypothetical protein
MKAGLAPDELDGLAYHGVGGGSQDYQDAVIRLLQFGDRILRAPTPAHKPES